MRTIWKEVFLIICVVVKTNLSSQPCFWSSVTVRDVDTCPATKEETQRAAEIKKCFGLSLGQNCTNPQNFKYHCLFSIQTEGLVEVCAPEISVNGVCLVYNTEFSKLELIEKMRCTDFTMPCPKKYLSTKAHLDAPCHKYINLTANFTSLKDKTDEAKTILTDALFWSLLSVAIVCLLSGLLFITVYKMNRKRLKKGRNDGCSSNVEEWSQMLMDNTSQENLVMDRLQKNENEKDISSKPEERVQAETGNFKSEQTMFDVQQSAVEYNHSSQKSNVAHGSLVLEPVSVDIEPEEREYGVEKVFYSGYKSCYLGEYNLWRTKLSDKFSTLTDDEVYVLFCFLCSDSGPPDFTDTEWLDLLNNIRQLVYRYKYPVTREEAQLTLDRLKSRDYLWEDQDKISQDTKDETMYRIASIDSDIPFYFSSYNTASVYLRSLGYNREPGEKCVISDGCDHLLIRRLQMNVLTHVTMEDTDIYDEIHQILNVSENILRESDSKRTEFLIDLRRGGEAVHYRGRSQGSIDHVTWLWRYLLGARPDIVIPCIGLHPHWDIYIIDNKAYRKPSNFLNYSPEIRFLLYSILLVEKYQLNLNEQSHKITRETIRDRYFTYITGECSVDLSKEITETHNGVVTFISDNIRHDVMYAFVTECLMEDSDLEFFLTMGSRDVISQYCRSWWYERSEGERCLYIPDRPEMYDLFIDKLQLDIITHCTMSDEGIHDRISKRLGVPREVLRWDQEARERYVEYAKRGTQTVHHARGMIVGCAGAGKTTLLKRLLRCSEEEIKEVKSTEGLEVHEEIFELCDEAKSLKARGKYKDQNNLENHSEKLDAKILTFFDFGGQCAYYACHQIYLTRRAFYVVVVDASKRLDQKVDKNVCDQVGSVFSGWTYGDYFVFWLKSIHTYSGLDDENDHKPVVLIVATHWEEEIRQFKDKNELMDSLRDQLPKASNLSQYIRQDRFHCIQLSEPLNYLEGSFYDIACNQQWKESIPKEWLFFQIEINQKKYLKRIMEISEITTKVQETTAETQNSKSKKESKGKLDMLRFYHDAGKVLYFDENGLNEKVIIDVQWFIDAFKHIITDKLHFTGIPGNEEDWDEYYESGNLKNSLLEEIWKHKDKELYKALKMEDSEFEEFFNDQRYLRYHHQSLLHLMQRLGLLVIGQESYYVPCMNRKEMEPAVPDLIRRSESKSSVLVYRFTFLPFFFFFRLVVACMQEENWKVLKTHETPSLYKDAALFSVWGYTVVLSVTKESIQLQLVHPKPGCILERDKTQKIQERVEDILHDFSGKFHRKLLFTRGFRCVVDDKKLIAMNIKGHFLSEEDVQVDDEEMICPLHSVIDQHFINTKELKRYWKI